MKCFGKKLLCLLLLLSLLISRSTLAISTNWYVDENGNYVYNHETWHIDENGYYVYTSDYYYNYVKQEGSVLVTYNPETKVFVIMLYHSKMKNIGDSYNYQLMYIGDEDKPHVVNSSIQKVSSEGIMVGFIDDGQFIDTVMNHIQTVVDLTYWCPGSNKPKVAFILKQLK